VGFNPYRRRRRRPSDYVMVATALVLVLSMVLWAFSGG